MTKWQSALLGVAVFVLTSAGASAESVWDTPLVGGPNGRGQSPYLGQSVGGSGGPTGSSIGTPGGSGFGPAITNPHTGITAPVGGGGGSGLTGRKK
jgi:hypothetical protein